MPAQVKIYPDLLIFMAVVLACTIVFAAAIFHAERKGDMADAFTDIPKCMWWTIITFSSVGYGDMFPGLCTVSHAKNAQACGLPCAALHIRSPRHTCILSTDVESYRDIAVQ